jgi:hypothetical protein
MKKKPRSICVIFNNDGTDLKKKIKNKTWWIKLMLALITSNILFFLMFSGNSSNDTAGPADGEIEIEIKAEMLTPFRPGKRVLVLNHARNLKVEASLLTYNAEPESRVTLLVKEEDGHKLLDSNQWEILPYLKTLQIAQQTVREQHEIRY